MKCDINLSSAYHIYSFRWTPTDIEWYIDNNSIRRDVFNYSSNYDEEGCFIQAPAVLYRNDCFPFKSAGIILNDNVNIAQGGGDPNSGLSTPAEFKIDYLEIWEKVNCDHNRTVTINDLSDVDFNVFAGDNITVDGGVKLDDNGQITVIANNSITLSPGFECTKDSYTEFRIDNSVCLQ